LIEDILLEAEDKMDKSVEHLQGELQTIRTGRANPALIEHVKVPYYGTPTPLNQLAQISTPEARLLVVQVYDRSQIGAIEKAIRDSGQGLNPANDGQVIRVPIPPLTEERRREYVRMVRQRAEDARVAVRNVRRDEMHRIQQQEREGELPADEARRALDQLQKLTDQHIARIDQLAARKEAEVMEV
jgi:ribosome recycling factor